MYSKEYDNSLVISKIHHKRKEKNKWFRKISMLGIILMMSTSVITIAGATETGTRSYGASLHIPSQIPPKLLINNVWGAPNSEIKSGSLKSYIYYTSNATFGWEWNRPNPVPIGNYIQPIFPEVKINSGIVPIKISNVSNMNIELQYRYVKAPKGINALTYDIWATSGGTTKAEIMVYIYCSTTNDCKPGSYIGDVNDGYNTYSIYYRPPGITGTWELLTFVKQNTNISTYKANIKLLLNSISKKLNSGWIISSFEFGDEVYKGSGRVEISKFLVT
jgi:hypothetical protein